MARDTVYPSNNPAVPSQPEKKKYEAVLAEGRAVIQKKSLKRRLLDVIIPDDPAALRDKIIFDYAIPGIKKGLVNGLNYFFFGEPYRFNGIKRDGRGMTAYDRMWDDRDRRDRREERREDRGRDLRSYENIKFYDYAEAKKVLENLYDDLERYRKVEIAAIYEHANLTSMQRSTDFDFGWRNLNGSDVMGNDEDGYYIYIPRRPMRLED